ECDERRRAPRAIDSEANKERNAEQRGRAEQDPRSEDPQGDARVARSEMHHRPSGDLAREERPGRDDGAARKWHLVPDNTMFANAREDDLSVERPKNACVNEVTTSARPKTIWFQVVPPVPEPPEPVRGCKVVPLVPAPLGAEPGTGTTHPLARWERVV